MRSIFIFFAVGLLSVSAFNIPLSVNQHWAQRSVRSAVKTGIQNALAQQAQLPKHIRFEVEDVIVNRISERLTVELNGLNVFIEESNKIAQDYVTSSVKAASTRTRWPSEQIIQFLSTETAKADEKIAALRLSSGLVPSESRISAVNREEIVANIVSDLMKDPSFQSLIGWLATLPASIHMIADEFLANKTFKEIFESISSRSDQLMEGIVQGLAVKDSDIQPDATSNNKPTGQHSESAVGLVGAGIQEAQSVLQLIQKTYQLMINHHIEELNKRMTELRQQAAYIPAEVMDYIQTSAVHMMEI